jgi:hypothetical protein
MIRHNFNTPTLYFLFYHHIKTSEFSYRQVLISNEVATIVLYFIQDWIISVFGFSLLESIIKKCTNQCRF